MVKKAMLVLVLVLATIACSVNVTVNTLNITPTPVQSIEVAAGKPTSSSGYWYHDAEENFPPPAIADGKTQELNCMIGVPRGNSYWLLPEKSKGWVEIDLLQEYQIVKVEWLNTHNGDCMDRATTRFHISISNTGEFAGEEKTIYTGRMKIESAPGFEKIELPKPASARYVRFYVDGFYKNGGGLNELRIYAVKTNH
jgi:hypothetical protein